MVSREKLQEYILQLQGQPAATQDRAAVSWASTELPHSLTDANVQTLPLFPSCPPVLIIHAAIRTWVKLNSLR